MPIDVQRSMDFGNARKVLNLPAPTLAGDAANKAYVDAAIEGLNWKDNVRVSTQGNLNLAAPGAAIDSITMAAFDRFVARSQTAATENGIYIWNGAATPATRANDANTFDELENAIVAVDEGTSAGSSFRQSAVNGVIGTNNVVWGSFGTSAPAATETASGIAEIATQAETDAGTDDLRFVTPLKLANSAFGTRKFNANIGDGSATSILVTHNLNTRDVECEIYRNSGNFDSVLAEIQRTSVNTVTVLFDTAPAAAAFRIMIRA